MNSNLNIHVITVYSSTLSLTSALYGRGKFHAPAALIPQVVWTFWGRGNSLASTEIRAQIVQPVV